MDAVLSKRPHDRFTPAAYQGREGAPVYLVAKLAWKERARFRQQMNAENLRYPDDAEVARAGIQTVRELEPSNAAELEAAIEAFLALRDAPPINEPDPAGESETKKARAARHAAQAEVDAERARRLAVVVAYNDAMEPLRAHPRVGRLLGMRVAFQEMVGPICASYVLRGWENVEAQFRRIGDVVPDEVLEQIPEDDLRAIGARGIELMNVSAAQRGN